MSNTPSIQVRGIRGPIPSGFVVGRTDPGSGQPHLIPIDTLVDNVAPGLQAATGAGATSSLPPIADKRILANISGGSAAPAADTLTAILDSIIGSTKGMVFYRDAAAWQALAAGSDTNVLTLAGGVPTWAAGGGGGSGAVALISTQTAAASASLAWTGLTTQTSWRLVGRLLVPASNNVGLGLVFGTGAGPTYIVTGYNFGLIGYSSANTSASFGAENQTVCPCDNGTTANAGGGTSFDLSITTDNANFVKVNGTCTFRGQTSHDITLTIGCNVPIAAAITAMKLSFGSGNITSGNASLYSVSH